MRHYLICYDITEPHRLARVFRCLKRLATPVQYSVFLFSGTEKGFDAAIEAAARLIVPEEDDLRGYPLPSAGLQVRLGVPVLPAGVHWSGLPAPW